MNWLRCEWMYENEDAAPPQKFSGWPPVSNHRLDLFPHALVLPKFVWPKHCHLFGIGLCPGDGLATNSRPNGQYAAVCVCHWLERRGEELGHFLAAPAVLDSPHGSGRDFIGKSFAAAALFAILLDGCLGHGYFCVCSTWPGHQSVWAPAAKQKPPWQNEKRENVGSQQNDVFVRQRRVRTPRIAKWPKRAGRGSRHVVAKSFRVCWPKQECGGILRAYTIRFWKLCREEGEFEEYF